MLFNLYLSPIVLPILNLVRPKIRPKNGSPESTQSDILLHKAAKKYFDDAGLKKLPAIKEINSEYAELIAKKKTAYAEYRKARDEMKELLIVKANVDRILGIEKDAEIEKDEPTSTRS